MRRASRPIGIVSIVLLIATVAQIGSAEAPALPGAEVEGMWRGTIRSAEIELRVIFTIFRDPGSTLTASMDVPEQNASDIAVDEVVLDGEGLRLGIASIGGVFAGTVTEDGDAIDGQWSQSGMTLPLTLERIETKPTIKRPQEPEEPFPYRVEEVEFGNNEAGITLAGTLTLPPSETRTPAALLLSGSGPQDRDETVFGHRPFLVLADYLTRRGIAVLRVDDRGVGGSTGDFSEATAMDFKADATAGVGYLKSRKEIDNERIGLIGHSEGGIIAPMVAVEMPDLAFVVLIAAPGLPIKELEHSQQARDLRARGASEDLVAKEHAVLENLFDVIAQETDGADVLEEFDAIMRESFESSSEAEREVKGISEENLEAHIYEQFERLHSPWFRFYLPYDPGTTLQEVTCPVLALNGEKDVQVPASENLQLVEAALEAGENEDYTTRELRGLNHLLQTAETGSISEYAKIEETMSPAALQIIGDWVMERM